MYTERGEANVTLLVIILIVVALFVAGYFKNDRVIWDTFNVKSLLRLPCGITVYDPKPDTKAVFPLHVDGYANGCGWIADAHMVGGGRNAGTAQVFDAKGIPVTVPISLLVRDATSTLPLYFSNDLPLLIPPATDTGTVIFISSTGLIHSVPINF